MRSAACFALGCLALIGFADAAPGTASATDSVAMAEGYWQAGPDGRGPLFRLRRVDIRDEGGRAPAGFTGAEFAGAPAGRQTFSALQAALSRHLLDHGFPFAEFDLRPAADSLGRPLVDLSVRVRRGSAYRLGGIKPRETRTRPETVRRLALWETGEPFSRRRLELGLRRLERTGYFAAAELEGLYRDSTRNLLYPALRLPDAPANRLGGLLGYDSDAPGDAELTGYLDVHLVNAFGTARDFDFVFENRAQGEREVRLAYVEPWILGLNLGARAELDFLQQDTAFWEWNRALIFFRDFGFHSRLELSLGNQENRDAVAGEGSEAYQSGLRLIFDYRDRALLPRSGHRWEGAVAVWRREIADSSYYLAQFRLAAAAWLPLGPRWGLKLGGLAASNLPLENRFNRGELYYLGGARSLRGYREREFLTNAYAASSLEAQLWLGRRGRLFAFGDPGLVNRLEGQYHWRRVLGYGAGMELSQGEWSLSVTYALNPTRDPGDGLLHLGVDNRF